MTAPTGMLPETSAQDRNQQGLVAELAVLADLLRRHAGLPTADASTATVPTADGSSTVDGGNGPEAAALDLVVRAFGLSPFERSVLLLCAGPELDGSFAATLAGSGPAHDDGRGYPSFGLALAALPDAHWSALSPAAPLRRWRLVELADRGSPTTSPLRIDEYVLHLLAGVGSPDTRLTGLATPAPGRPGLPASLAATARRLVALWRSDPPAGPTAPLPCLVGPDRTGRSEVAGCAAAYGGLDLLLVDAAVLPHDPAGLDLTARLLERTCVLEGRAALVEVGDDDGEQATALACRLADELGVATAVSAHDALTGRRRRAFTLEVGHPTADEQRDLWLTALGDAAVQPADLDRVVGSFDLDQATIRVAARVASATAGAPGADGGDASLWEACRRATRPRMDALAQRVVPGATYQDLVLPDGLHASLREMALQVRHRATVYGSWGMRQGGRGLATTALFTGPSGTGKTMAAEALAADLELDLYRVDLSAVVSKYIGETEKNLRRLFDAAEDAAAVLVFDEADALFGQRTQVKDSHDRYANIEVSYLLQRIESYRGVAVLTTNVREALDRAFLRRIRFVLDFPFPGTAARQAIWDRAFPATTPTEGLDSAALARLNLAGGGIRSVALSAAFHAAADGGVVRMDHVLHAARAELAKLDLSFHALSFHDLGGAP